MAELLVFGSIAYDCIETPIAKEDYILGGSASYAALAASYFAPVKMEITPAARPMTITTTPMAMFHAPLLPMVL